MDWDDLEKAQGCREELEAILQRYGEKNYPRSFDVTPPEWWR